ncbi:uncharacterized protein LOC129787004 [Lutzomyia longipalpis]|uniref:uncharacterized protein LOC129787004 n=1 Tax=Lutzomyia longipalpis TaxID=7200 RepID=UPI002483B54F|nr:uncharacterized protein LOC129787004 [Lutzomyia longipalpis]
MSGSFCVVAFEIKFRCTVRGLSNITSKFFSCTERFCFDFGLFFGEKMRLSLVCLFKRTVNGHIFRGKDRLVKRVSKRAMERLRVEYDLMEQNMLYLRHPYLTIEESAGHTKELGKNEAKMSKWQDYALELKRKPHITIEERLKCLKIKDAWD